MTLNSLKEMLSWRKQKLSSYISLVFKGEKSEFLLTKFARKYSCKESYYYLPE